MRKGHEPAVPRRTWRLIGILLACAAPAAGLSADEDSERDYRALTNTRRSVTNFNPEVVRGIAFQGSVLWTINCYESTLIRFDGATETGRWRTLTNPVSVAVHDGEVYVVGQGNHALARHDATTGLITDVLQLRSEPADIAIDTENDEAWISCMGDDSVVQVDLSGDLAVVDVWNYAKNSELRLKRPRFLYLDLGTSATDDNVLYVAPMASGNGTTVGSAFPLLPQFAREVIVDTDGFLVPLPDEDLFRIDIDANEVTAVLRGVNSLQMAHGKHPSGDYWMVGVEHLNADSAKQTEPLLNGQFALNRLQITSSALPTHGNPPIEPDVEVDLDGTTYSSATAMPFPYAMAFDETGDVTAVASSLQMHIAILDANGDQVLLLTQANLAGTRASVVRSLVFQTLGGHGFLFVYCQQSRNILVFRKVTGPPLAFAFVRAQNLGNDPTPAPVRRGRGLWYDGTLSLNGRVSCNTCHPQGAADGIAWQLSDEPIDYKDVMVTQTLLGIEDTFPYHWRGERNLAEFNGAFSGLLGHTANLDEEDDLPDFMEFLFSLRVPANPRQSGLASVSNGELVMDFDRKIKDALTPEEQGAELLAIAAPMATPLVGDPTEGDMLFHETGDTGLFGSAGACASCHPGPTGSNNDFFADDLANLIPFQTNLEVAHLDNQLVLKEGPVVQVQFNSASAGSTRSLLGYGTSHNGVREGIFGFVAGFFTNALGDQGAADVSAFVQLFDTGTAPSVHCAVELDPADTDLSGELADIQSWLLDQAEHQTASSEPDPWVGVVVIGDFPIGSPAVLTPMTWYYDTALTTPAFVPANPTLVGNKSLADFEDATDVDGARNVFLGVAPGNERRLGADYDDDGLDLAGEAANGTNPWSPDSDADHWPDGYEVAHSTDPTDVTDPNNPKSATNFAPDTTDPSFVEVPRLDFVTATVAKLFFTADEPVRWEATITPPGSAPVIVNSRLSFDTTHTVVLQGLYPSTVSTGPGSASYNTLNDHDIELTIWDLAGNSETIVVDPDVTTTTLIHDDIIANPIRRSVVGDLCLLNESTVQVGSTWTWSADLEVEIVAREESPPYAPLGDRVVVVQVLKQDSTTGLWEIVPLSDITHDAPATDFDLLIPLQPNDVVVTYSTHVQANGYGFPGDFLVLSPTAASGGSVGRTTLDISVADLDTSVTPVLLNIMAVIDAGEDYDENDPVFDDALFSLTTFINPATPTALRRIEKGDGCP